MYEDALLGQTVATEQIDMVSELCLIEQLKHCGLQTGTTDSMITMVGKSTCTANTGTFKKFSRQRKHNPKVYLSLKNKNSTDYIITCC